MDFGRTGLCFWDEFPGRLPLLGKRFRAMDGPGCKKVNPCHLYLPVKIVYFATARQPNNISGKLKAAGVSGVATGGCWGLQPPH